MLNVPLKQAQFASQGSLEYSRALASPSGFPDRHLPEREEVSTDTRSTHALMRGAVLQLRRWGVLPAIAAARTPPIRSSTFSYTDHELTVAIEPKYGVSALDAPRRTVLDRVLADAAADAGAEIRHVATSATYCSIHEDGQPV